MRRKSIFTENELAILQTLWSTDKALSRPEILEHMAGREMNPNTFHFTMNRLIEKGCVEVVGVARCGMNYGRTYLAKKTREDYLIDAVESTVSQVAQGRSIQELMTAYIERRRLSPETITELEELLAKRRRELEQETQTEQANSSKRA